MPLISINPTTETKIKEYPIDSASQWQSKTKKAHEAFLQWKSVPIDERARYFKKCARTLLDSKEKLTQLMSGEMGKPVTQGRAEIEKCAMVCEYYAESAKAFLAPEWIKTDARKSYASFQPLGVVLALMPWNFPFWQVFRFLAPGLMAGNAGILKHAHNVTGCAIAIEDVLKQARFPEGLFQNVFIDVSEIKNVIADPHIKAVTLTGSTPAGKAVASQAGAVLKKCVLELGGSDPYVILADADLEKAAAMCVSSRMINGGQSCVAAKRFIVVKPLVEKFEALYVAKMKEYVMGDPSDEKTTLGPLARLDLRDNIHKQVTATVKDGAKLLLGGKIPDRKGAFYPATVLSQVLPGMTSYREEIFGPVASIIPAENEADALRKANDSSFGLGAAVFSQNLDHAEKIAAEVLEAGCCFVNSFVKSDPRLPFGGIKESGYGRELSSFGIREFVNIKTVYIA